MAGKVTRIIVRNGTEDEWLPGGTDIALLGIGEIGYELDTNKVKIGHETPDNLANSDGLIEWDKCDYITDVLGVADDYTNIIELDDDGLIFAPAFDDTEILERLDDLEEEVEIHHMDIQLLKEDVIRTGTEVDGGTLLKNELGILFHYPSIKLKPIARQSLDLLLAGVTAEEALKDFLEGILGAALIPLIPIYEYTILAAVPQDIPGMSLTVKLPCKSATYIDWGDGTIVEGTMSGVDLEHTYPTPPDPTDPPVYIVKGIYEWDNTPDSNPSLEANINKMPWMQQILQFGRKTGQDAAQLVSGNCAFAGYSGGKFDHNPATAPKFRALDTSNLTDFTRMFYTAREMNDDINWMFNTNITTTHKMLQQAEKFNNGGTPIEFSNLTGVNLIAYMFAQTGVTDDVMVNLPSWDVSNVTDENHDHGDGGPMKMGAMRRLLNGCINLSQPDLSGWNVGHLSKIRNLESNHAAAAGQQFFYTRRQNIDQPQKVTDSLLPQFGQT